MLNSLTQHILDSNEHLPKIVTRHSNELQAEFNERVELAIYAAVEKCLLEPISVRIYEFT